MILIVIQVLSDDEKRSLYDKYGEAGLKGAGMGMGVSIFSLVLRKVNSHYNMIVFPVSHLTT